ncbi:MAG TPA: PEGA domain-containing protein, partial [Polyangiaceae bacterium]
MITHRTWFFWLGCFLLSANAVAQSNGAQSGTIEQQERNLLEEGYSLRKLGKDAEALTKYEQAFALRGDKKALAQIALTKVALGDWVQAYELLKQALGDRAHPWIVMNRELLESELERIKKSTATLTLEVTPQGSRVELNGHPLGAEQLGTPLMLNPGPTSLDVTARGYAAYHHTLHAEQGRIYHEVVHLVQNVVYIANGERPGSAKVIASTLGSSDAGRRNPIWIGAALGGALLTASAIVPWAMANHRVQNLEDECRGRTSCDFEGA